MKDPRPGHAHPAPLFIVSFRHGDELSAAVVTAGWEVVLMPRAADAERHFLTSGAVVAVIDARGALDKGREAASAIAGAIAAGGGALLVLVSPGDIAAISAFFDAGATHFLAGSFSEAELIQALRFAERHAERVEGGRLRADATEPGIGPDDATAGPGDSESVRRWIDRHLAGPDRRPISAMLVALDRFDIVNAHGRSAGEALLRAAFKRIEDAAGRALVARVGGSHFLVVIEGVGAGVGRVAERIAEELARPVVAGDTIAVLGSHIGIARAHADDNAASLLRRASEALADARATDSIPDGDRAEQSIEALAVELHLAMERGEIDILFQPQVSVPTGAIVGVEALARWDHSRLGTIGAEILFQAARRARLDVELSDHIQRVVLERAAAWPEALAHLRLSLNLTAADIARPGFADMFLDRVDASGFPRDRLSVEIVETGLIEDLGIAAGLLAMLRAGGCRVAIDDFGTGYSSLSYLKSLPLDYLKIDKRLTQDITGRPRDRVVVRGVIRMARLLDIVVIAEGVETPEQLDLLAKDGCQLYQGFLCSEPVSSAALVALVEKAAH